jgi:hypothetical protein
MCAPAQKLMSCNLCSALWLHRMISGGFYDAFGRYAGLRGPLYNLF